MKLLFLIPFLVSLQNIEGFIIGKWKVIEEDKLPLQEDFHIEIYKDHQMLITRNSQTNQTNWKLIQGKKTNLLIISNEDIFALEIHGDSLFLLSEAMELVLLKQN